jgi:hypothetical protein
MRLKNKTAIVVGAGQTPGDSIGNGRASTYQPRAARATPAPTATEGQIAAA